jgi:hypothetical protein
MELYYSESMLPEERDLRLTWKAEDAQRKVSAGNRMTVTAIGGMASATGLAIGAYPSVFFLTFFMCLFVANGVMLVLAVRHGNDGRRERRLVTRERERLAVLSLAKYKREVEGE